MEWRIVDDRIELQVSRRELTMLNNGLNEALALLDDRVFPTRVGASSGEARELLLDLRALRSELDPDLRDMLNKLGEPDDAE